MSTKWVCLVLGVSLLLQLLGPVFALPTQHLHRTPSSTVLHNTQHLRNPTVSTVPAKKPPPPPPPLSPAEEALRQLFITYIYHRRSSLDEKDLHTLADMFGKTVIQNKDPRPQHKNPSAFTMEGCPHHSPQAAIELMKKLQGEHPVAYLSTPCLSTDSFGNFIANYLEGRMCANFSGLHYVATNVGWDIPGLRWNDGNDVSIDSFLQPLPSIVFNSRANSSLPLPQIRELCFCGNLCHVFKNSFIGRYPNIVQEILTPLYENHQSKMLRIDPSKTYHFHIPHNNTAIVTLPPIPDVAIHYRCGDNVHSSGMGLLRFSTLKTLIPANSTFVYVMSEDQIRKTRADETSFCSHILTYLHEFLVESFPEKTIVVLRGAKIFDDMTRLALASTTVASLSSFSLFPAITNPHKAFYPAMPTHKSGLFQNHQPNLGPGFTWLGSEHSITSDTLIRMGMNTHDTKAKAARVFQCLTSSTRSC